MIASLLFVLTLAAPLGNSNSPRDRAAAYYAEGLEHYSRENYQRALKSFEMALLLAKFEFTETELIADVLRMASSSAILTADAKRAPALAREYVLWADKHGRGDEVLRARNDLVEALLLSDDRSATTDALRKAEAAAARAASADERNRLAGLRQRVQGRTHDAPAPTSDAAVVARTVRAADDDSAAPQDRPAVPVVEPRETEGVLERRRVVVIDDAEADAATAAGVSENNPDGAPVTPQPTPPAAVAIASAVAVTPTPTPAPTALTPTAAPIAAPTTADAPAGDEMVLVPAGTFTMGDDTGASHERPTRTIAIAAFWLDRHEVTNAEYRRFVTESGYRARGNWEDFAGPGHEQEPVRGVTQEDADFYARARGKRLPTEAEWERAARGEDARRYAFGDRFSSASARVGRGADDGPAAVGTSGEGPWGLRDLTGNVMEWCADRYDAKAYRTPYSEAPQGPAQGVMRVARGGAWDSGERDARNAARVAVPAARASSRIGFRCARDAN